MHVQGFHASAADGSRSSWHKTDEQTWRIDLNRATSVTVSYQIYANTLRKQSRAIQREARVHRRAFGLDVFGRRQRAANRTFDCSPERMESRHGNDAHGRKPFHARIPTIGSPMRRSKFPISKSKPSNLRGTKYHVIDHDIEGGNDFTKFTADTEKIVQTLVPIFADVAGTPRQEAPFKEYWFLFHIWPKSGGGLEHLNSTQINFRRTGTT